MIRSKREKDGPAAEVCMFLCATSLHEGVTVNTVLEILFVLARSYKCTPSPKNDRWSPSVERTKIPSLSRLSLTVEALFRTPYILYRQELCVPEISAAASAVTSYVGTSTHVGTEESRKTPKHAKQISNSTDAF